MAIIPISGAARVLIMGSALLWQNREYVEALFDRVVDTESAVPLFGYRMVAVMGEKDASGGAWTQRAQFGVHWLNTTGGDLDTTWTSGDFSAVETGLQTFWSGLSTWVSSIYRLEEIRWYGYGPDTVGTKDDPIPVYRVTAVAGTPQGGASSGSPSTNACAITLKTALRKHWGRFYVPINATKLDVAGRLSSANCDTLAAAAQAFLRSGESAGVYPVVYDKARKSAFTANDLQVDDIADVIRRRRQSVTQYRKVLPIHA